MTRFPLIDLVSREEVSSGAAAAAGGPVLLLHPLVKCALLLRTC